MDIFLGRQPIFGRHLEVFGYELLYRAGQVDHADLSGPSCATSQVLLTACTEIGLERVVGARRAFVNLTREFIVEDRPLPIAPDRVVLEVLEDVAPDDEVVAGLRRLSERGFRLALDDYAFEPEREPLLELVDVVKVEFPAVDDERLRERVESLGARGLEVLAEKIETQEEFDRCRSAGFSLFQGHFLARPRVIHGRAMPVNRLSLVRLLARLQDPSCDVDEVSSLVGQDVSLSYRLLRHINSALYGLTTQIASVREAVVYLGLARVKNLASLFLLSTLDDKPSELIQTAMVRARMMELLAPSARRARPETAFTTGLFSALDALLDAPLITLLQRLPLVREVAEALLRRGGPYGPALGCVLAYERGEWEDVRLAGVSDGAIRSAFLDSVEWVERARREQAAAA